MQQLSFSLYAFYEYVSLSFVLLVPFHLDFFAVVLRDGDDAHNHYDDDDDEMTRAQHHQTQQEYSHSIACVPVPIPPIEIEPKQPARPSDSYDDVVSLPQVLDYSRSNSSSETRSLALRLSSDLEDSLVRSETLLLDSR